MYFILGKTFHIFRVKCSQHIIHTVHYVSFQSVRFRFAKVITEIELDAKIADFQLNLRQTHTHSYIEYSTIARTPIVNKQLRSMYMTSF